MLLLTLVLVSNAALPVNGSMCVQAATGALTELADSYQPEEIGQHCYHLYEQFRPTVAGGQAGWGQRGHLDLNEVRDLAKHHSL